MSIRQLVDVSWDGTSEFAHFDSEGNLTGIEITNDVEDVIDNNKRLQNDGSGGYGKTREWKHEACIPMGLVRQWEGELGVPVGFLETKEGFQVLLAKIRDPEFKYLRVDK